MDTSSDKWFVEQFHLRSPVEEFEDYSRAAIERLADGSGQYDDSTYREAVAMVLGRLRPDRDGIEPPHSVR